MYSFFVQYMHVRICLCLLDLSVRIPTCSNHSRVTRYYRYCMRGYEWGSRRQQVHHGSFTDFSSVLYLGNIKSGRLHLTITQFKLLSDKVAGKNSVMVTIWEAQILVNNSTEVSLLSRQNARNFSDLILIVNFNPSVIWRGMYNGWIEFVIFHFTILEVGCVVTNHPPHLSFIFRYEFLFINCYLVK